MNIISVLAFCTLVLFIQATDYNEGYYVGFIDTLGIDTHVTDDGVDCTEPVKIALNQFKDVIVHGHKNTENVLQAVADVIDRLKFEVSPLCRTFYGEFLDFMEAYYGDAEELKSIADRNLKEHNEMIEKVVNDSRNALLTGDDYGMGKGHANVLKLLLDLEKAEAAVEKTIETAQEILEIAKEEIVKLGQAVNETVQKVKEELAKEEDVEEEEEEEVLQGMEKEEEPVHEVKEAEPVQVDMQVYNETVDAVEDQHEEDEDGSEDGEEEENAPVEDLTDQEEIGTDDDLKNYPEDDKPEEEEEVEKKIEEEEEEEEEEDFSNDDDVANLKLEEQRRQDIDKDEDQDDLTDDDDTYLSQYDDEVVEIQRRVLSQDYYYDYDL